MPPTPAGALALMTFLASDEAQRLYARINFEYPIRPGLPGPRLLPSLAGLPNDSLSPRQIADNRAEASLLLDDVGFND